MRIIILGYIVRGPYGGLVWHHLQYVLGLKKLGHEILFLEDSDNYPSCSSPLNPELTTDASYGLRFIQRIFNDFNLTDCWSYYDEHTNTWFGLSKTKALAFCKKAAAVINISGINPVRSWWAKVTNRILIDTDPVFTQIRHLTKKHDNAVAQHHTAYFSFGENVGKINCGIPNDGFKWKPTRQPVFLDAWKTSYTNKVDKWTTVMQWDSYNEQIYNEKIFGMKSVSFEPFYNLPARLVQERFELALGIADPVVSSVLQKSGWKLINSLTPTKTPWTYQQYIRHSKGEWSVAKHGYVVSNSGWFSERSACYLASGKPAIVQETGFSQNIPTGKGLLSFTNVEECIEMVNCINKDYKFHCIQARKIAIEQFASDLILKKLLQDGLV